MFQTPWTRLRCEGGAEPVSPVFAVLPGRLETASPNSIRTSFQSSADSLERRELSHERGTYRCTGIVKNARHPPRHPAGKQLASVHTPRFSLTPGTRSNHGIGAAFDDRRCKHRHVFRAITAIPIQKNDDRTFFIDRFKSAEACAHSLCEARRPPLHPPAVGVAPFHRNCRYQQQ